MSDISLKLKHAVSLKTHKRNAAPGDHVITLENIEGKTGKLLSTTPSENVSGELLEFEAGDILFNKLRPYLSKAIRAERSGLCSSELLVLRPNPDKIDQGYLFYCLLSDVMIKKINNSTYGTKMPRANWDFIGSLRIEAPHIKEQQKIVSFLDGKITRIDALMNKKRQLLRLLEEKKHIMLEDVVIKGLNPSAPTKATNISWASKVPAHWELRKLKYGISELETGVSVNAADSPIRDDEVGVLKTSCVYTREFRYRENKTVDLDELTRVKCPVRGGTLIISRMNTPGLVGAAAYVENSYPNLYLPDRLWQTKFNPGYDDYSKYLGHFLSIKGVRDEIALLAEGASGSMQSIAKKDFLSIPALWPPKDELKTIIEYLDLKVSQYNSLSKKIEKSMHLLGEYRNSLVSSMVSKGARI